MNKINKIVVFVFGLILPVVTMQTAQADIASDMASDVPFERVIKNALKARLPMSVVLVKMFSSTPEQQRILIVTAAISAYPLDVALVVRTAIRAGVDAEEVVAEAVALTPLDQKVITRAAIASGADVVDVTLASAAGMARSGVTLAGRGGAIGAFGVPPVEAGFVPPITAPRINGGGPVTPPVTGVSPS